MPKSNVTPSKETRQDYRGYYTPKTEALVRDWYAPEIELLNYGFLRQRYGATFRPAMCLR